MLINLLVQAVTRVEDLIEIVGLLAVKANLTVDHATVVHEPRAVVGGFDAEVVTISRKIIKLVHIDAITERKGGKRRERERERKKRRHLIEFHTENWQQFHIEKNEESFRVAFQQSSLQ